MNKWMDWAFSGCDKLPGILDKLVVAALMGVAAVGIVLLSIPALVGHILGMVFKAEKK